MNDCGRKIKNIHPGKMAGKEKNDREMARERNISRNGKGGEEEYARLRPWEIGNVSSPTR